jgi:soluble lytic murein transglycosylase
VRWVLEGPHLGRLQAEAWWLLALASDAARDLPAARSAYAMVWWGFPDNPQAAAAERKLRALSSGRAPVPSAHARAMRAFHLLERWESDAAERELARAVKGMLPASVAAEAWYQLGLLRVGTRAGVVALEQAVRFPQERDRTLFWLGVARLRTGRAGDAASTWAHLRAAYPDSRWTARALAAQGRIAEAAGHWQEADRFYVLVIDRYPDSPRADDARWRRAWMRRERGLRSDARALLLRYGRAAPDAPRAGAQLYWAARLSGAGQDPVSLWREVAEEYPLTFYGQRARERLGLPPIPGPPELSAAPLSAARFHLPYEELAVLGAPGEAMEEIEAQLADDAPDVVRLAAAELYAEAGDATRAITSLEPLIGRALYAGQPASRAFWQLAYPRPFWPAVVREAARRGVDPLLVLALMREESRFDPRAVSTANAVGLMQLLPSTARGVLGGPVSPDALKQPDLNIRGGTAYLAGLLRRYGGRVPPSVAAYNAGPGGVRRHVDLARSDLDRFVEELPYAETRAYVQRVLQSYGIYRWLYR